MRLFHVFLAFATLVAKQVSEPLFTEKKAAR